jgi:amino acid adenylation domain-containing protein/non-ribosomal peptide synthase protein (TIGR01720 family)
LLSALMLAYSSWTGEHQLSLHLEGHGREQFSDDIDVTRTIGWFTSLFPVYLEIEEVGVEKVLKRVKEQLRSIPNKGFGYGILRYLSRDKRKLNLKCLDKTQILFNYLGQVDIDLHDEKLFSIDKTVWLDVFNDNNLSDSISIIAEIRNSNFFITFYFDQDLYAENSICAFANDFKLNLKKIITHCLCKTSKGFTPSDFPLAKLDQAALDDFTYETKGINSITNIETIYSLNPLQKGLLFHMLCDPNSDQYFTQITMEYVGELDQEKFKKSWEIIIAQHDILRTRFVWKGIKEPLQIVHKKIGMMWHEEDWSSKKTCEQDRHLNKFLCEDRKIGFDFNVPGLMRFSLIKLADNRYQFVWSHHHMILDGWCLPILLKELNETYKKLNSNRLRLDRNLDYLPNDLYSQKIPATYEDDFEYYASKKVPQYENYIDWLQQQPLDEAKIFWKNQLKDLREPISLSICKTLFKTHKPIENITIFNFYFSEKMTQEFRLYAKSCKITLNSLVKLAWITVLWKYSGQYDIVTGTTFSGRLPELSQVNEMIGLFINTLPTRLKIDSSKTVKEHLLILHDKIQKANQYSYLSLSEVHKCSDISPDVPLFSNLFIFDSYQLDKIPLSEKVLVNKVSIWEKTNYPLVLAVEPKEKLELSLSYDTKSFSKESIRRLSIHLKCALQWILKNPNNYLVQINILSNYERQLILRKSHGATIDYPKDLTLHEVFEQQATNFPNNIAVETNGQKFTYKELNEQSNSLANYIKKELKILDRTDIKEELIIGIYLGQGIDLLVSILAILKSGGAYLPLDIEYPKERLKFMTEDSNIQFILTKNIFQQRLTFLNKPLVCIDKKKCEIAQESLLNIKLSYNPRSLAYILYTSGSTGKPKGTMIEHLAVINRIAGLQQKYSLNTKDTILFYTSICFDVSITEIFWPLLTGAKIKIPSKDCHRDVNSLIEEIDMSKISYINFLPSFLHVFLESLKPKQCYSLKNVFVGVEELSAKTIHMFHNKLTANLYNAYGVTESVVDATHFNCSKKRISEKVPIGTPLPNTQTFILDQFLSMLPFGVAGELYIGGDSLARGYLNRSKLSSEKFIEKPSSFTSNSENNNKYLKKEYLYRTGDLARWREDGNLEFLGRFDNQIKIRGFRVELEEIEETLNRHENVIQSVLTSQTNDESVYLIAYYKSRNGTPIKLEKLQTYLENYLPAYMIPCMFVHLEHFPLTANGKVNRHALPKIDRKVNKKQIKPQTELEELLSVTWKDTLDLKQIDSNDNFFYSGGNSILAMRLISSLNQKTGLNLPVSWVFQYTTIKKQANCIKNRKGAAKYKPIICFNEKTNNSRSLFFVHPGFNGAEVYNKLAKYLDKHYSFFAIESYNLYSGKTMIESINELASLYIKNMKTIQPRGPYHLGGWCMGGLIAYEMASQLMKKNEKVSIVYLLDSFPGIPKELKKDFVSDQADRLLVESVVKFLSSKYKDRLKKLAFLEAKMVCSYEVKPYPGKVALFKAMKGNEGLSNINLIPSAFDKKWAKFVLKRDNDFGRYVKDLEVHSINCVHEDMSNLFFSKIISDLIVKSLT